MVTPPRRTNAEIDRVMGSCDGYEVPPSGNFGSLGGEPIGAAREPTGRPTFRLYGL